MSISVVKEVVDYTWVIAKQLDRVANAASNIDFSTQMKARVTTLSFALAVRQLYNLVKPCVEMRRSGVLADFSEELDEILRKLLNLEGGTSLELIKSLEEIEKATIKALYSTGLLLRIDIISRVR